MSGKFAYTALPAVVTPLVYPPGWNPGWDFLAATPRAYPPGYTPEFSIVATGTNFTTTQHGIHISSILYDHGTYATNEPSADSEVIITAFIDGVSHKLRFSGDITFLDAIACPYSSVSGFWGTDSYIDVNFDMSGYDGKTLTFVVAGVVEGQIFTDTVSMGIRYSSSIALPLMAAKGTVWEPTISGGTWTCKFDVTWSMSDENWVIEIKITDVNGIAGYVVWYNGTLTPPAETTNSVRAGSFVSVSSLGYASLTELGGSPKMLRHFRSPFYNYYVTATHTFTTYLDGIAQASYSINRGPDDGILGEWLTFDSRDGTVTIINP